MTRAFAVFLVAAAWWWQPRPVRPVRIALPRRRDTIEALPELISLIRVGITAGLSAEQTIRRLQPVVQSPTSEALTEFVLTLERHIGFSDATHELITRLGEPARPLADALATSHRYGLALLPSLDRALDEARHAHRRQVETAARRLPVLMCFPLALCILPAFVLLTIVPALLGALSALT